MTWKVMLSAPYLQTVVDRFEDVFKSHDIQLLIPPVNERLEEDALIEWLEEADGAICGDDRFSEKVLRAAPKLKVISKWGTGIDSIDLETCSELGIVVRNTPNAFSEPVADSVFGYILCFARNLPWMDNNMRQGQWQKILGHSLRECVLGIIGVGDVGKAVARRSVGFGMGLLGNDPKEMPSDFLRETGIKMVSKDELLAKSDYVSLNCDLNPSSHHLMNDEMFALMKADAVIINTSRGPAIEEPALVRALEDGQIRGAALDVFEDEPLPPDSPLLRMDNVMLAPHNANTSPGAWEHVHHNTIHNLIEELRIAGR